MSSNTGVEGRLAGAEKAGELGHNPVRMRVRDNLPAPKAKTPKAKNIRTKIFGLHLLLSYAKREWR